MAEAPDRSVLDDLEAEQDAIEELIAALDSEGLQQPSAARAAADSGLVTEDPYGDVALRVVRNYAG